VIWSLSLAVLEGGKNRAMNARLIWSHEKMEPTSREWNQALALYLKEKGKKMKSYGFFVFFYSATESYESRDMEIGILSGWSGKLILLHQIE